MSNTDEIEIIQEFMRPCDIVKITQVQLIHSPKLEHQQQQQQPRIHSQELQQQHEKDGAPSILNKWVNLTNEVMELENSKKQLTTQLKSERASHKAQFKMVTTQLQEALQQKHSLQDKHDEAIKQRDESRRETTILKDKYEQMETTAQKLKRKLETKKSQVEKLEADLKDVRQKHKDVSLLLNNATVSYKTLEENNRKLLQSSEATILELKKDNEKLRSLNSEQSTTISSNCTQIAKLYDDLKKAKNDSSTKDTQIAKTKKKLNKANIEIKQLKMNNKDLTDKLEAIFRGMHEEEDELSALFEPYLKSQKEEEGLPTYPKRGRHEMDGGEGESSNNRSCNTDSTPVVSDSQDDMQSGTSEDSKDSIVVPHSKDYDDPMVGCSSSLGLSSSFNETTRIKEDADSGTSSIFYHKFHKYRRNNQ